MKYIVYQNFKDGRKRKLEFDDFKKAVIFYLGEEPKFYYGKLGTIKFVKEETIMTCN